MAAAGTAAGGHPAHCSVGYELLSSLCRAPGALVCASPSCVCCACIEQPKSLLSQCAVKSVTRVSWPYFEHCKRRLKSDFKSDIQYLLGVVSVSPASL